jgi:hypothetical protein
MRFKIPKPKRQKEENKTKIGKTIGVTIKMDHLGRSVALIEVFGTDYYVTRPWLSSPQLTHLSGTGFFVEHQQRPFIVTCYHVIRTANPKDSECIRVRTMLTGRQSYAAHVVAVFPQIDAALLQLVWPKEKPWPFRPWKIAPAPLRLQSGTPLRVFGYPLAMDCFKSADIRLNGYQGGLAQIDGAINSGHSGAPVVYQPEDDHTFVCEAAAGTKTNQFLCRRSIRSDAKTTTDTLLVVGYITSGYDSVNSVSFFQPIDILTRLWDAMTSSDRGIPVIRWWHPALLCIPSTAAYRYKYGPSQTKGQRGRLASLLLIKTTKSHQHDDDNDDVAQMGAIIQHVYAASPLFGKVEQGDLFCGWISDEKWYTIDGDGHVQLPWRQEPVLWEQALALVHRHGQPITLRVWSVQERKMKDMFIDKTDATHDLYLHGLCEKVFPLAESLPFVAFGGLVVQPLSMNLYQCLDRLQHVFYDPATLERAVLVVSFIFPNTALSKPGVIQAGDVLLRVNGRPVSTLNTYRQALLAPDGDDATYKTMSWETISGTVTVFSTDVLRQEDILSSAYPMDEELVGQLFRRQGHSR